MCSDIDSQYKHLLCRSEFRWLSTVNVLICVVALSNEIENVLSGNIFP
jgi:hypothetical protein